MVNITHRHYDNNSTVFCNNIVNIYVIAIGGSSNKK